MAANYIDLMKKKPFIGPKPPNSDYTNGLKAIKDQSNITDQGNGTVHATTVTTPDKPSEPIFKAPEKFSYDANTDPAYQAALRQAQQGAQTATNNAMVSLGSRGIGNSSIAVDRGNQIQQQAIGNVNDTILPQLMSQAYGRYQDQNNNDYRNALANYNVGRDQVGDNHWQTTRDDGRTDAGNNLAVNVGQLTGNYQSPENAKSEMEMLANSAAYGGANSEDRVKLHDRNMVLAKMLGKTYDLKTGTYSGGTGTRTVAGQQLDLNKATDQRDFDYKKKQDVWSQAFAKEQYSDQKAQQVWENTFKDKSFTQSMKDAAASRGLQWASLNQRDKEFVADSAFREKNFVADQEQRKINNLKSGSSAEINKEIDGLYTGLTSGQITGSAAIQEIDGKVKAGILNKADADRMKSVITTVASSMPNVKPKLTQDQIDANGGSNPQDLNSKQLDKLWSTDPTGKAAGRPSIDWGSWYTDPRGKVGGISYDAWKKAYGPQLKAR